MTSASFRGPYRQEMECKLTFDGPWHIGTGQRLAVTTDSPILRDDKDNAYLPGSSIRGVLRDWCEREAIVLGIGREVVIRLFGPETKEAEKNDRRGRLTVSDAIVAGKTSEIRDHVKIDRQTGAAANGGKFDNEVALDPEVTFSLVYEGDGAGDKELVLLAAIEKALKDRVLFFGAKSGWGYGAVRKAEVTPQVRNRADAGGLQNYLLSRLGVPAPTPGGVTMPALVYGSGRKQEQHESDMGLHPWSWLSIEVELPFDGPMLVAGPFRDEENHSDEREYADAVYIADRSGKPFHPGSSLRGALSAHASRIATTMNKIEVARALFGTIKAEQGQRGLLHVSEGALVGEFDRSRHEIYMNHVAIDRVTGFAAEGKLFNTCALASPRFRHRLFVRWKPGCKEQEAAVALLLFTLRDMQEGLIWCGSRTTRGYGHLPNVAFGLVKLSSVEITDGAYSRKPEPTTLSKDGPVAWAEDEVVKRLVGSWTKEEAANG